MLVEQFLCIKETQPNTVDCRAPLTTAAMALSVPRRELVVVCNPDGRAIGVLTKADVVRRITHCEGSACQASVTSAMTKDIVSCRPQDQLADVWSMMKTSGLRHIPVLDDASRPLGVLNAWDTLEMLLDEVASEEKLMREYLQNTGYH